MCVNQFHKVLKMALIEKDKMQRDIVKDAGIKEDSVSRLMRNEYKNDRFDAWVLLNLNIDLSLLLRLHKTMQNLIFKNYLSKKA